jgi:hypothetical protein
MTSALHKIKFKKNTNPMKILSDISAVEIRCKKTLNEERMIEMMQSCAGDDYAEVIVVADGIAQLKSVGTCNATALEMYKAMQKMWQIAGHNDDEEDDNNDNDSKQLETLLGAVKQKQGVKYPHIQAGYLPVSK